MTTHGCRPVDQFSTLLGSQKPSLPTHNGTSARIIVLKVGTSTLLDGLKHCYCLSNVGRFVDVVCDLKDRGYQVVMISSGAVGAGCIHMHLNTRPSKMAEKQAISAIGQSRIIRLWEDIFAIKERKIAQLLLTRHDLMDRPRFVNFRNTLLQLLSMDVIPVINENDALATEGLKFGDNDTLGAYVSISIGATWFFMLTDVDCLYTSNPRHHPEARPIAFVRKVDAVYKLLDESENEGTQWGSGGMRTKVIAAKLSCATGVHTALCHGKFPERVLDIITFAESGRVVPNSENGGGSLTNGSNVAELYPLNPISGRTLDMLQRAARSQFSILTTENESSDDAPQASHTSTQEEDASGTESSSAAAAAGAAAIQTHVVNSNTATGCLKPVASGSPEVCCLSPEPAAAETTVATTVKPSLIMFPEVTKMPYIGTIFMGQPCTQSLRDQRRWILSLPVRGKVFADENCVRAVIEKRKSLFAAGIVSVAGEFFPGEAVGFYASHGKDRQLDYELARFITNFSSHELSRIQGRKTVDFQNILGYYCAHEVAHRSNIIFVDPTPVYEKYSIPITAAMANNSDEEDD